MEEERAPRVGVSWMQVAGSALAAVSSAVLLSTLGVAGTVIGAALGSVVATIGTALYTRTLDVSRQQVAAQTAALRRVARARGEIDEAVAAINRGEDVSDTGITRAGHELDEAEEALAAAPAAPDPEEPGDQREQEAGPDGVRRGGGLARAVTERLSWRRLAVVTAAVFAVAMGVITAFELTTGRAVSVYTGGSDDSRDSTVPGLGRRTGPSPSPSDTVSPDVTEEPEVSDTGSPTETPDPSEPTDDPTDDPSDDVSEDPTTTPAPSPSPSLDPTPAPSPLPSSTGGG